MWEVGPVVVLALGPLKPLVDGFVEQLTQLNSGPAMLRKEPDSVSHLVCL